MYVQLSHLFLFWKCLDDMSYWTNLYRTVADNELHFVHNFKLELYSFCEPCPKCYFLSILLPFLARARLLIMFLHCIMAIFSRSLPFAIHHFILPKCACSVTYLLRSLRRISTHFGTVNRHNDPVPMCPCSVTRRLRSLRRIATHLGTVKWCIGVCSFDPEILSTPACSINGSKPHPRSHAPMLLGTGGLWLICTLHAGIHDLHFHTGQCVLEGGTEIGVGLPNLGSCVSALKCCPAT